MTYDYKTKTITITSKELIELIRKGKIEGQHYPDDEIVAIVIDD